MKKMPSPQELRDLLAHVVAQNEDPETGDRDLLAECYEILDALPLEDGDLLEGETGDEAASAECQNCDWRGDPAECRPLQDVLDRVDPGEVMPIGECPECGCVCHFSDRVVVTLNKVEVERLRRLLADPLGDACQGGDVSRSIARKLGWYDLLPPGPGLDGGL